MKPRYSIVDPLRKAAPCVGQIREPFPRVPVADLPRIAAADTERAAQSKKKREKEKPEGGPERRNGRSGINQNPTC